jgi:hypothetical protein
MRDATSNDTNQLPVPLRRAEEQFQRWRKTRQRGTPIPERLWSLAMELAAIYGVCKTASTLKLDYYGLKKRLGESTSAAAADQTAFLEIPISSLAVASECLIECENSAGARMRIHVNGIALSDLAALGRSLWSAE